MKVARVRGERSASFSISPQGVRNDRKNASAPAHQYRLERSPLSWYINRGAVDVVDYPDSKKIAIAAGVKDADFKTATYVGLGRLRRPTITTAKTIKS
jgi:hypothetical protein